MGLLRFYWEITVVVYLQLFLPIYNFILAGKYKTIPVAIKMLFTQDLNPDVVKRCGNEARILTGEWIVGVIDEVDQFV